MWVILFLLVNPNPVVRNFWKLLLLVNGNPPTIFSEDDRGNGRGKGKGIAAKKSGSKNGW